MVSKVAITLTHSPTNDNAATTTAAAKGEAPPISNPTKNKGGASTSGPVKERIPPITAALSERRTLGRVAST